MENTEVRNRICSKCGFYAGYYTKAPTYFVRTKKGHCAKIGTIVNSLDTCNDWCSNHRRKHMVKNNATRTLSELLFKISQIKQILLEELEDIDNEK